MRLNLSENQAEGLLRQLREEVSGIRKSRVHQLVEVSKGWVPMISVSLREKTLCSVLRAIITKMTEVCLYPQTGNREKSVFRKLMTILGG